MAGQDRRQRLASDAHRVVGYMNAVIVDAERAEAEVPEGVRVSISIWRVWTAALEEWAGKGEGR